MAGADIDAWSNTIGGGVLVAGGSRESELLSIS